MLEVYGDPVELLQIQIKNFYGIITPCEQEVICRIYPQVLDKLDKSFLHINNKYYHRDGHNFFSPFHLGQYTMYLYTYAQEIYKEDNVCNKDLCDKIYGVSKCFSSADLYYEVMLPTVWFADHPQGSVIGRAQYGDFFFFSQGCTVGNNKGIYPVIGNHVCMFSNSEILGKCTIGDHVIMSANSYVIDRDIPSYSIVKGQAENLVIREITPDKFKELCSFFIE